MVYNSDTFLTLYSNVLYMGVALIIESTASGGPFGEQEKIAILKTNWVAISLGNLQHLPQDLTQDNCTGRILRIRDYK